MSRNIVLSLKYEIFFYFSLVCKISSKGIVIILHDDKTQVFDNLNVLQDSFSFVIKHEKQSHQ